MKKIAVILVVIGVLILTACAPAVSNLVGKSAEMPA